MTGSETGAGASSAAPPSTPGPGAAAALLLIVAVLFVFGGVPLQLLLGEGGLLVAQIVLLLFPALLFVWWRGYDPVQTLSLRRPTTGQVAGGLLCLMGGVQLAWFLAWAQSLVMPVPVEYLEAMTATLQADSLSRFLWLVLLAAVAPAVAEEVLFRGVVLSGFRRRLPALWAVVASGLVFGLFHLTPQTAFRFLPTAWLGILLAGIVVISGSLLLSVGLHFLNNASILLLTAIPLTRERLAGAEEAPPLVLLPFALLLLFWGFRILGRPERAERAEVAD